MEKQYVYLLPLDFFSIIVKLILRPRQLRLSSCCGNCLQVMYDRRGRGGSRGQTKGLSLDVCGRCKNSHNQTLRKHVDNMIDLLPGYDVDIKEGRDVC